MSKKAPLSKKTLLTVRQAAHRMTVSVKTTWRMVYSQELEVVRIGRCVRITEESVEDIIDGGTIPPTRKDDDDEINDGHD